MEDLKTKAHDVEVESEKSDARAPNTGETIGCALLAISGVFTGLFGLMALGSLIPELVRTMFVIAVVALTASVILVMALGSASIVRHRRRR